MVLVDALVEFEAFLWADYKCKPLSRMNREAQPESLGKKGNSLFGLTAMFKIPSDWSGPLPKNTECEGELVIVHIRVCFDDSDQKVWHSAQVLLTSLLLLIIRAQYSFVKFGPLFTDGAGNFKAMLLSMMLPEISAKSGFRITSHLLPEVGGGKDRCDRDFTGCNKPFESWVKVDGRVRMTVDDICDALEAGAIPGVVTCALLQQRDGAEEKF